MRTHDSLGPVSLSLSLSLSWVQDANSVLNAVVDAAVRSDARETAVRRGLARAAQFQPPEGGWDAAAGSVVGVLDGLQ